jgi:hypothetical protein
MTKHKKAEGKDPGGYRAVIKRVLRVLSGTSLPEIMLACSFIIGRYLINADFQYPGELILPSIAFAILVTIIFFIYKKLLRDTFAAHVAALLLLAAFINYGYLPGWLKDMGKSILPKGWETGLGVSTTTALLLMIGCASAGLLCYWIVKRVTLVRHLQPLKVLLFVITFVFVSQLFKMTTRLIDIQPEMAYKHPSLSVPRDKNAAVQKPDIYYLVFDRYASDQTLSDIYHYDNPLTDFLGEQGFVTREHAYANYPFTMESITSTLDMQYHTELEKKFGKGTYQGAFAYRAIFNNPPVAQLLKQNGYTYNQVSSWWDFTRVNIQADTHPSQSFRLRIFGKQFYLGDLERDFINQSILSAWLKQGLSIGSKTVIKYDMDNNPRQNFYNQMDALKRIATQRHNTPQFTFAHVLSPHDPYVFDADGSEPKYDGARTDDGLDEFEKYKRQLTYANTQIKDMLQTIRERSPNAVIIIQADEGPYPKDFRFPLTPKHYYDPSNLALPQQKQKLGIIASYYMPGLDQETVKGELTSSVNAFRFVFKHYLGYQLDMLPDCTFATGDKFVIYRYEDITKAVQGSRSDACNTPNKPL